VTPRLSAARAKEKRQAEIEQMKRTAASMPPEQRKALEEAIEMMETCRGTRRCASFGRTNDRGSHP
jgi:hypothetical protein